MLDTTVTKPAPAAALRLADREAPRVRPPAGRILAALVTAFAALVGLGALLGTFLTGWAGDRALGRLDRSVSVWLESHRTPTLNTLSDLGSGLSDTSSVIVLLVLSAGCFWLLWRRRDEIALLVTGLALEVSTFVSIAYVVGRDRPPVAQLDASPPTSGFPSGHTAAAVALYFGLVLVVYLQTDSRVLRRSAAALATIVVVAVAASRMYRGMHFPTDVVAGAMLGAACLTVAWLVWSEYGPPRHPGPGYSGEQASEGAS